MKSYVIFKNIYVNFNQNNKFKLFKNKIQIANIKFMFWNYDAFSQII